MLYKVGLFFLLALGASSVCCTPIGRFDLTFYVTSLENDELICGNRAPVKAVSKQDNNQYGLVFIWDDLSSTVLYNCRSTKYFYVAGKVTEAFIETFADDYMYVFLNDVQVTAISSNDACAYKIVHNLNLIKSGLNKLHVNAYNTNVIGYFGYKITIKTKL
ncbi:hypothetical protein SteCoe_37508 [Stentor coeruleus]|uniref:Uncharacterized protein n=1 Tax=Stentor coeruleus TaxID=5963 RepID=A0A1R2AN76_9CILI|nr:hypothetical protein SteCoe_37508 [Stentor coeruleus]